jgi:hypothetical protein
VRRRREKGKAERRSSWRSGHINNAPHCEASQWPPLASSFHLRSRVQRKK